MVHMVPAPVSFLVFFFFFRLIKFELKAILQGGHCSQDWSAFHSAPCQVLALCSAPRYILGLGISPGALQQEDAVHVGVLPASSRTAHPMRRI